MKEMGVEWIITIERKMGFIGGGNSVNAKKYSLNLTGKIH